LLIVYSSYLNIIKFKALWDIAPCSIVEVDRWFRDSYYLLHQGYVKAVPLPAFRRQGERSYDLLLPFYSPYGPFSANSHPVCVLNLFRHSIGLILTSDRTKGHRNTKTNFHALSGNRTHDHSDQTLTNYNYNLFAINLYIPHIPKTVHMNMTDFWDVALCSLVETGRCFRRAYCLHYQGKDSSP
jgi:hypothetical protein